MNVDEISDLDKAYDAARQQERVQAISKQFSPEIRETPLAQALAAGAAGCEDWVALLQGWVEEQWTLHRAGEDLVPASELMDCVEERRGLMGETGDSAGDCADAVSLE